MLALALLAVLPLRFHFDASEFSNSVHHVSCLSGQILCTSSVYKEFWKRLRTPRRSRRLRHRCATARYERKGTKGDDPYHHPYIPRVARSTLSILKDELAKHGTLLDGFVDRYISAGKA